MKLKTIAVTMGTALALFAGAANAGDPPPAPPTVTVNGGTVHFKGKLVAAPCSVSTDARWRETFTSSYQEVRFICVDS